MKPCKGCDKPISAPASKKFCSKTCSASYWRQVCIQKLRDRAGRKFKCIACKRWHPKIYDGRKNRVCDACLEARKIPKVHRRVCLVCKNGFDTIYGNERICSAECRYERHKEFSRDHEAKKQRAKKMANRYRACLHCGRQMDLLGEYQRKFCSEKCRYNYREKRPLSGTCSHCAKVLDFTTSRKRKFCDKECMKNSMRGKP